MIKYSIKYLFLLILGASLFAPQLSANEINLFDGLIKIKTGDDSKRHDKDPKHDRRGHYEIINGKLVWVEERKDRYYDDEDYDKWVLLTRIRNNDFDWIVIRADEVDRIRNYIKRGYQRSMTGRKRSCIKMGNKKERLWEEYHDYWQ